MHTMQGPVKCSMGACIRTINSGTTAVPEPPKLCDRARPPCGLKAKSVLLDRRSPRLSGSSNSAQTSPRILDDPIAYDEPWDQSQQGRKIAALCRLANAEISKPADVERQTHANGVVLVAESPVTYDEPWDTKKNAKVVQRVMETAFCTRTTEISSRRHSQGEALERKIQHLCHGQESPLKVSTAQQSAKIAVVKNLHTSSTPTRSISPPHVNKRKAFASSKSGSAEQPTSGQNGSPKDKDSNTEDKHQNRVALSLNFGCAALNPIAQKVDANLPLTKQPWYHGAISRADAEQKLSACIEGSYLVRLCESGRDEFALSLKSARGFMHMKIQPKAADGNVWVLGYFSQPFASVPHMIRYYSVNKLPIKGAEHMCLLHPLADQVL